MPCQDITDSIKILLDKNDRVVKYALRKKTCKGEVGRKSLISRWLKNKKAQDILDISPDEILAALPTKSKSWEYLTLKHFLSVKAALQVMLGETSGSVNDYCTIDSIEYSSDETLLTAEIANEGITAAIEACGGCSNCSSQSKTASSSTFTA